MVYKICKTKIMISVLLSFSCHKHYRLDDITFKRYNSKSESQVHSAHKSYQQQKYENVALSYSNEIEPQQTESCHDEYESRKQNDNHSDRKLTLFGERLYKRIMEDEKEEKKQLASLKCSVEPSAIDISEENVMESDKENGAQSDMNNKDNEFVTTTQNSTSGNKQIFIFIQLKNVYN